MSLISPSSHPKGPAKLGPRRNESNVIYANPLPLLFETPQYKTTNFNSPGLGLSINFVNPHCEGVLDSLTRSIWVTDSQHSLILWRRGFFGKGLLSRSEPSWLSRQRNTTVGKRLTSEELTARRRAERKQFKIDRARAIAAIAEEAEALFASEGRIIIPALSGPAIPSAATWRSDQSMGINEEMNEVSIPLYKDDEPQVNAEHLQLTLQEAFFLSWNLDCLSILDPQTVNSLTLQQTWLAFQRVHCPPGLSVVSFDNPFLVYFSVYNHYRSLGWVVKGGVKFCVDYLLYKRGPVFAHAEFAIIICPIYEDPDDQACSPFTLQNTEPLTWSWLSTINRVNSQVQKTLILTYVTIPARSRVSLDLLESPRCLAHYSVREVILRRFIPARMRD
ncbi:hypothetical protein AMATHDRAFT_143567 [Amanita thiersii Skay4041]|uniref:tRNA-splicing endonuclease subunit Sen2 n=1 Tax=Amanita thiersii Skay4041 TaxID=703135 RepID=A0A2A9NLT3_9AGAR|nr:hypothetical protein AMATHDRAFT_143567 [Amanita thiersii Skay4041]